VEAFPIKKGDNKKELWGRKKKHNVERDHVSIPIISTQDDIAALLARYCNDV